MSVTLELKYGLNPNQKPASLTSPGEMPLTVVNGRPGSINLLDALNGWQLVRELQAALGLPAAASFKHVSPSGAAVGVPLSEIERKIFFTGAGELSPLAAAYARARGTDRLSSFGDFVALSDVCDLATAKLIHREVSDGVIAPGYTDEALAQLKTKRGGSYVVLAMDPEYVPAPVEHREVFGLTFAQGRNDAPIDAACLTELVTANKALPAEAVRDLLLALITLKYTQSNSVCFALGGQTIGVGAGQQSRIHCTRIAGDKADNFRLRMHPKTLALPFKKGLARPDRDNAVDLYISERAEKELAGDGWQRSFACCPEPLTAQEKAQWLAQSAEVCFASDAFFPFEDNILRAAASGARYIAQPGGSIRDEQTIAACDKLGLVMAFTHRRLFHH